jgi:hypothetical protein
MSFKSEAQRRKFAALVKEGKMAQTTWDEFEKKTKGKLPERVKEKEKPKAPRSKAQTPWKAKVIK